MTGGRDTIHFATAIVLWLTLATAGHASHVPDTGEALEPRAASVAMRSIVPTDEGPAADLILRRRSEPLLADPAAALRAASEAVDNRNRSHAVWLLEQTIGRHRIVADHASLMQIRLLEEDGHPE
jgi:hypothetical protein